MIYNVPIIFNTTFDIVTPNEMKTKELNSVVSKLKDRLLYFTSSIGRQRLQNEKCSCIAYKNGISGDWVVTNKPEIEQFFVMTATESVV